MEPFHPVDGLGEQLTRIVLDPGELAGAASELRGAAGEYEAIGARVASCNCHCMPPDVAAAVDAATAEIRARLQQVAGGLVGEGGELAWRAGIEQEGAGGGFAVGGTDPSSFGVVDSSATSSFAIGGTDPSWFGVDSGSSAGAFTIGGTDPSSFGVVGGGSAGGFAIGGTDPSLFGISNVGSSGSGFSIGGAGAQFLSDVDEISNTNYTFTHTVLPLWASGPLASLAPGAAASWSAIAGGPAYWHSPSPYFFYRGGELWVEWR